MTPHDTPSGYMTRRDVAAYLKVAEVTIDRWRRERRLPHLKIGTATRYYRPDIDKWAAEFGRVDEPAPSPTVVTRKRRSYQ